MSADVKGLVYRYVDEVWNEGNLSILDELVAPEYVEHDPSNPFPNERGPAVHRKTVTLYRTAFADAHMALDEVLAEGDRVTTRWTGTGKHTREFMGIPATNRPVKVTGVSIYRFERGKMVEGWGSFDQLGLLRQLGLGIGAEAGATVPATTNGVDVGRLRETVAAIEANPKLAGFRFRARNTWVDGACSVTMIKTFSAGGNEDALRATTFELTSDEPAALLGEDRAPNPVETVLHALASCLSTGFAYHGAAQGVRIDVLTCDLEGELDLRGFLGLSDRVRPGYGSVRAICRVKSSAPAGKLNELAQIVQRTSPVLDMLRNAVQVSVEVEK